MKKYILSLLLHLIIIVAAHGQYINPGLVLTFDDYSIEEWYSLLPVLDRYDAKATFFISNPEKLNTKQIALIKELIKAGNEIGSHGHNHLNARKYIETIGAQPYLELEIIPSIHWFDSVIDYKITSFAYPYGARSIATDAALIKHFDVIRSSHYKINADQFKVKSLTHKGTIFGLASDANRGYTLKEHQKQLLKCYNQNLIQVIYAHVPVEKVDAKYQIQISTIDSILNYADSIGLNFYTASETRIKTPPKPNGQIFIKQKFKPYEYKSDYPEHDVIWHLEPENAGEITTQEQKVYIKWNRKYKGDAKLKVAGINRCGQGEYSKPLTIFIE